MINLIPSQNIQHQLTNLQIKLFIKLKNTSFHKQGFLLESVKAHNKYIFIKKNSMILFFTHDQYS